MIHGVIHAPSKVFSMVIVATALIPVWLADASLITPLIYITAENQLGVFVGNCAVGRMATITLRSTYTKIINIF